MHWFAIAMLVIGALVQAKVEPFEEVLGRGYTYVANDGVYGIIIDERYAPRLFSDSRRETIDGYWTPAADDIAAVEEMLKSVRKGDFVYARERALEKDRLVGRARVDELVSRQYVGFIAGGARFIDVIGFCSGGIPSDPLHRLIIADGGPCYWTALIDADSSTIESYVENGEA